MSNIIFFGPPGAGKGTQAKIISKSLNISHLSTGDVLRERIKKEDELGNELKDIISSGKLVSDEILNRIVKEKIENESRNGFLLDGYPRTLDQAFFLNNLLKQLSVNLDYIIDLNIDFTILKQRILKRAELEKREDDELSVINTRFNEYLKSTKKVSDFYRQSNPDLFYEIDANLQIDEITEKIKKILKKSWFSANIFYIFTWLRQ